MNAYLNVKYAYSSITAKSYLLGFVQSVIFDPEAGAVNIRFATDIYPIPGGELRKNFTKVSLGEYRPVNQCLRC